MKRILTSIWVFGLGLGAVSAQAQTSTYPGIRYISPYSQSMGGVTLPLTQEVGNDLFNNPAGLARSEKFKAEYLNLVGDLGGNMFGAVGTGMTSLGGLSPNLNSHTNSTYAEGFSNLTALSWGGLGVGLLYQERVRAYSDGTNAHYETSNLLIPAVGYGLSLARGIVRLGYSLQYVNEASGTNQVASNSSAAFLSGINQGHAFASTASINIVFPFQYLPSFSLIGRNIGGLHYSGGNILSPAKNVTGLPADETSSFDASFNFTVRLSGSLKSYWFAEYDDMTNTTHIPFFERLRLGAELSVSRAFEIRVGTTGGQFSGGIGFKSESSEINVSVYADRSPFSSVSYWDTRYALQYKVFFQDHNSRDRDSESRGSQQ